MKLPGFSKRSAEVSTFSFSSAPSAAMNVQIVQASEPARPRRRAARFAGAQSDRLTGDWNPGTTTRNDLIQRGLRTMRSRSRQLVNDNEHAKKILQLHQDNIVGLGFGLTVEAQDDDGSLDVAANNAIKAAWDEWSKPENCTVRRKRTWWHIQRSIVRCEPQAGEVFLRLVPGFKNKFRFAVQLINPDCVDEELNKELPNGNRVRMGVETNQWGEPVAYYIRQRNPYDSVGGMFMTKHERVPAEEIIHKFTPLGEEDELRGVPLFHAPMKGMHNLEEYDEAAMFAARIGAANAGFFEEMADSNAPYEGDGEDELGDTKVDIEPGQALKLPRGIKFTQMDAKYPHELYADFVKVRLRTLAAGVPGINYNQLAGDYESVNYSSLRAAFLESQDAFKALQKDFIDTVATPVFSQWLKMALLAGAIQINGRPLPREKFEKFNKPKFVPRGFPWVDPEKEVGAAERAVKRGYTSKTAIILEKGNDPDAVRAQIEADNKNDLDYDLDFDQETTNARAEALGKLALSGAWTPTQKDEEKIRRDFRLPPLPPEAAKAWKEEGGTRKPIAQQGGSAAPKKQPEKAASEAAD